MQPADANMHAVTNLQKMPKLPTLSACEIALVLGLF